VPRLAAYNNIEVRALVRDAEKAASLEESGADLALGTFEDPQAIRAAVDGVDTLCLNHVTKSQRRKPGARGLGRSEGSGCP
jgi:uncharacterized protein YbjT (DUF2867 family)